MKINNEVNFEKTIEEITNASILRIRLDKLFLKYIIFTLFFKNIYATNLVLDIYKKI